MTMRHPWIILMLALIAATGCARGANWGEPAGSMPQRNAMALPTADVRWAQQLLADDELPWYANRNDVRLAAEAGSVSPIRDVAHHHSFDRRVQSGAIVRDYSSQTVYRRRVIVLTP
jgi:hypothetical protein